ncbi:MAG: hypothetical protein AAGD00_02490 [Planctomycetota bacterium]
MIAMRTATALLVLTLPATLLACAAPDNDRLTIADRALPGVDPQSRASIGPEEHAPVLARLERDDWATIDVVVGIDVTEHQPTYTRLQPYYARETARQRGEHPDARSSLELGGDACAQVAEGFGAPFWAAMDVVLFPVRLFTDGAPGEVVWSPDPRDEASVYERYPAR